MVEVSIIVPVYNSEKYLEKCIESLLTQSFKNFELILVNDGSTDNSPQMCDFFANKDSRVRVIHKQNGGVSETRNIGLRHSTGRYVMFVDSDDFVHPHIVDIMFNEIENKNADIAVRLTCVPPTNK